MGSARGPVEAAASGPTRRRRVTGMTSAARPATRRAAGVAGMTSAAAMIVLGHYGRGKDQRQDARADEKSVHGVPRIPI